MRAAIVTGHDARRWAKPDITVRADLTPTCAASSRRHGPADPDQSHPGAATTPIGPRGRCLPPPCAPGHAHVRWMQAQKGRAARSPGVAPFQPPEQDAGRLPAADADHLLEAASGESLQAAADRPCCRICMISGGSTESLAAAAPAGQSRYGWPARQRPLPRATS